MIAPAAVWRPRRDRLRVKMPERRGEYDWLLRVCGVHTRPEWDGKAKVWKVARVHLQPVIAALAEAHGEVRVIIDQVATTKCGPACQGARGDECSCQCLGDNHGIGRGRRSGWIRVGEEWLIKHEVKRIEYRVTKEPADRREAS